MSPVGSGFSPSTSFLLSQAASATTAPMAATRVRLVSRNILMSPGVGLERGLEAEREDVRVQRVGTVVEGNRGGGRAAGRPLVQAAAAAWGEDVGIARIDREALAQRQPHAEHAERTILLGEQR